MRASQLKDNAKTSVSMWAASLKRAKLLLRIPPTASTQRTINVKMIAHCNFFWIEIAVIYYASLRVNHHLISLRQVTVPPKLFNGLCGIIRKTKSLWPVPGRQPPATVDLLDKIEFWKQGTWNPSNFCDRLGNFIGHIIIDRS